MAAPVVHAKPCEQLLCARAALPGRHPGIDRRDLDVLGRGEIAEQMIALEDEAEMLAPQRRQFVCVEFGGVLAGDTICAGGRAVEAAEDVEQRRFSGSGRAYDRHHLAGLDAQRQIVERHHARVTGREFPPDVLEGDDRIGHLRDLPAGRRTCRSMRSARWLLR
ncbi:hypothetical protein ABIF91_006213 [Bradyrhizobium sp. USDA 241]